MDRDKAIALLDELHWAQNELYGGGEEAATIGGRDHHWSTVGLYDVYDQGRIAACWLLPLDQGEFDAIWSA